MAKTARDIVTASLRKLGVVAAGETPSAEELQDALFALQGMIDSWSNSDLLSFSETEERFSLVPDQQAFTIGPGGDFDTSRPMDVYRIAVVDSGLELPCTKRNSEEWRNLSIKNLSSSLPTNFHFRPTWPLGTLLFHPIPTEAKEVVLYTRKPFASVDSVNTVIDLPNGYERAIIYNLPFDLVDEYGGEISAATAKIADDTLSAIKAQNLSKNIPYLATEGALQGGQKSGWTLADFISGGN